MSWSTPLPPEARLADPVLSARIAAEAEYDRKKLPTNAPDRFKVFAIIGETAKEFGATDDETIAVRIIKDALQSEGCVRAYQIDTQPELSEARRIIMLRPAVITVKTFDGPDAQANAATPA